MKLITPRLQLIAAALCLSSIAGCVTPPKQAYSTPIGNTVRFTPEVQASVKKAVEARDWLFVDSSISVTENIQTLTFIDPGSITRFGSVARFKQLNISAGPRKGLDFQSNINTTQIDCSARTFQVLQIEPFSDQVATKALPVIAFASKLAPIQVNTIADALMVGACTGQFKAVAKSAGGSSGSGVAIAPNAVLTNQHVVAGCSNLEVLFSGKRYPATVRKQDANNDLALLDVSTLPPTHTPALRKTAATGESVMVAGYPLSGLLSSDIIVTDGIVNSLSGLGNNASQLQISAPVQPGNSGGPLLDRGGNLVGLVVSKLNAQRLASLTGDIAQNINFAIKPEIVSLFLQSENLSLKASEQKGKYDTQGLAEVARAFTMKVECKAGSPITASNEK